MKLKYEFVFQPVGKIYMGVAVNESADLFNGMLQLNEEGYDIVKLMVNDITRDEIVDRLLEQYSADREVVEKYVSQVIDYLSEQDVLCF